MHHVVPGVPESVRDGGVLLAEVEVGEGGVVGVDRREQAGGAHTGVDVVFQAFEAARDDHVRGRTHGDRDPLGGHAGGEGVIIENGNTVVDPFQAKDVKTRGDVGGRGVLALVPGQAEAGGPGETVSRVEGRGVDAQLGGVHSDPDDALGPRGTGTPERGEFLDEVAAGRGPEGAVHVTDEQAGTPGLLRGGGDAFVESGHDVGEVLPRRQVTGRGEETLLVEHSVGRAVENGFVGQARPVRARAQGGLHQPEHVQEPIERVVPVQLGGVLGGQRDPVGPGQLHDRGGAHRTLDVTVQLHLGQRVQGRRQTRHGWRIARPVQ